MDTHPSYLTEGQKNMDTHPSYLTEGQKDMAPQPLPKGGEIGSYPSLPKGRETTQSQFFDKQSDSVDYPNGESPNSIHGENTA